MQALTACSPGLRDGAIDRGYDWLTNEVALASLGESHSYVEVYDVTSTSSRRPRQWRETLHHHGLGIAAAALLCQTGEPSFAALRLVFTAIVGGQAPDGSWPGPAASPSPALWPTWHSVSALLLLRDSNLLVPGSTLVIFDNVIAVRRGEAPDKPLWKLVAPARRRILVSFFRRRWAGVLLLIVTAISLAFGAIGKLEWKDALLGLLLPVALFVVQETVTRVRRVSSSNQ